MTKPNFDTFLDLVERSGLVEKDQLHGVVDRLRGGPDEPPITNVDALADALIEGRFITPWQRDKLMEGRYRGFFLKNYKLLGLLGSGGMSQVYLAEHVLMQRRVAIKVLPKNRVADTSYLARFHREAQAAAALDHRNIVRAFDVDNEGETHFLVMEYVEGRDLQQIVKQDGPLPYAKAADYICQSAAGLAHAHDAGLIHRDVKPANLLVDKKDVVKVLDLGLARFTGEDLASLTVQYDENVLGTADYLAPEQAVDSHGVDARADIYSLGCAFYYLLTGHPPFPDGTLPQRLMAHQKQPPPSIFKDRPDAPPDLVEICMKMMAKKPDARYPSAGEVAEVLEDWLTDHGHSSRSARRRGLRPLGSGSGAWRSVKSGDSARRGGTGEKTWSGPAVEDAAASDTHASGSHPTLKNSVAARPQRAADGGSLSDPKLRERALPVAKPLDEGPVSPAGGLSSDFSDFLESAAQSRTPTASAESHPAPRRTRHSHGPPKWVWWAIAAGLLIGIALLTILVVVSS